MPQRTDICVFDYAEADDNHPIWEPVFNLFPGFAIFRIGQIIMQAAPIEWAQMELLNGSDRVLLGGIVKPGSRQLVINFSFICRHQFKHL